MTDVPDRSPLPTASLALGVAGLLPILPLIGSIGALACGYAGLRHGGSHTDRARAGIVLGWVGVVAPIVFLVIYCGVLGYPFPIRRYRPD